MINVIENLEHPKSISDIINDLNELILTLHVRNNDIIDEVETVTPEHIKTETNMNAETVTKAEPVKNQIKAETMTKIKTDTKTKAEPVKKQMKAETVTKTKAEPVQKNQTSSKAPAPGRGKIECKCGLMVCNASMTRHEKGTKHKEAMAKKEKTEMKQAEGQSLGVNDMDLVDIETYMNVMLPHLYK